MTSAPPDHSVAPDEAAESAAASSPGQPGAGLPLAARVEALLMSTDRPLSETRLADLLDLGGAGAAGDSDEGDGPRDEGEDEDARGAARGRRGRGGSRGGGGSGGGAAKSVREAIDTLNRAYDETGRAIRIERLAGGWQVMTRAEFGPIVSLLHRDRQQTRLSQPALETLAIIAYRQPIMRAEIEAIRGVACGEVLRGLLERRLVKIVGRAEELGRPMLYGTTREFLSVFGLPGLDDLPEIEEGGAAGRKRGAKDGGG